MKCLKLLAVSLNSQSTAFGQRVRDIGIPRTSFLLALLTLTLFACEQQDHYLTEDEKQEIVNEIRPIIIEFTNAAEKADFNNAFKYFKNSSDFIAINNGQVADYGTLKKAAQIQFESLKSQDYTITSERFTVISPTVVMYTQIGSDIDLLKDDTRILVNPLVASFLFQKIKNEWSIIYFTESVTVKIDSTNTKQGLIQGRTK